jgi:uncharacterized membrane protein
MEILGFLMDGFAGALTPTNLLFVFIGCLLGQIVGALPGIGPSAAMAILMPFTFGMPPTTALIMLSGIMYGGMYGGTLTSVLINVPGESASVMTAVDGYQLAKQGRAGAALSISAVGSFYGGVAALTAVVFLTPLLSSFALNFNSPEYFPPRHNGHHRYGKPGKRIGFKISHCRGVRLDDRDDRDRSHGGAQSPHFRSRRTHGRHRLHPRRHRHFWNRRGVRIARRP